MEQKELKRYSRQLLLPSFGYKSQEKLKKSRILVVGAGGLGCPVLQYLAAAGVGFLGIADFDRVEESNLARQVLYQTSDIGKSKVRCAEIAVRNLNPFVETAIFEEKIQAENVESMVENYEIIVDATDNLETRLLLNDTCVKLDKTYIYGAISGFEGQISVFNFLQKSGKRSANYRDLFPDLSVFDTAANCAEAGVLGVLAGIIGSLQATEAIKVVTNFAEPLANKVLIFSLLDYKTRIIKFNTLNNFVTRN